MDLKEFEILRCIAENGNVTQRAIADETGYSLGTVNSTVAQLNKKSYLRDGSSITLEGRAALEPYRVKNAIILAAGMSTRFVPFSYEKPLKDPLQRKLHLHQVRLFVIKDPTLHF